MTDPKRADRFDEVRRAWIAHHQGWSTIQRRRAEQLGRRVRARQRAQASAVPDPHDDTLLPPLWLRTAQSPASQLELLAVLSCWLLAPIGLTLGYIVKSVVTRMIPDQFRGFPMWALLSAAAGLAAVSVVLYLIAVPDDASLRQMVFLPWVCLQVAAVPATAGVLGIAEGWLAVPASRLWLPRTPPEPVLTALDAVNILGAYDLTGPGVIDSQGLNSSGERTP